MAILITDADAYITTQCLSVEDWQGSDDERKTRLLNVSERTIRSRWPEYTIPDNAVYEFANTLSIAFNDTNIQARNGVQQLSISGVASFMFTSSATAPKQLQSMIPQEALDLIGEANGGIKLQTRRIGQGVLK